MIPFSYEDAVDARVYEGHEAKGAQGDLWGIKNLLTFKSEGTSLQRVSLYPALSVRFGGFTAALLGDQTCVPRGRISEQLWSQGTSHRYDV